MEIRDKYYKKYRFVFIVLGLLFISTFSFGTENMDVAIEEIYFNYEVGNAKDALAISDNGTPIVNVPEWKDSYYPQKDKYGFAYIMGQATRSIKVQFSAGSYDGLMHLLINVSYISGDGIGEVCNLFVPNFDINNLLTLYPTGNFPTAVGVHEFQWRWKIYAIPINNPDYCAAWSTIDTSHHFYTLLAAPQAPMAQPWERVLDYACSWANGQTTSSTAAEETVQGLYNNSGFLYDIISGAPRYTNYGSQSFNLTYMLSELGGSNIIVNCYDVGKALNIFLNSIGCNSGYKWSIPFGFLNCVLPIGRSWTNNPFYANPNRVYPYTQPIVGEDDSNRTGFNNHAFCMINEIVYDACLKVDTDSNPDYGAPFSESWAINWDWSTYKNKVIDNNPATNTEGPYNYNFSVY